MSLPLWPGAESGFFIDMITHVPRRRPRAHLVTVSTRHVVLAVALAASVAVGVTLLSERAHSTTAGAAAFTAHR